MLAAAGYPLTPGVSAEPLQPGFVVSGYLQTQYETHQDSEDQLRPGAPPGNPGAVLINQDRFSLRRARLRLTRDWQWAQLILELDGNTMRGPAMRFQKAEASLIYGRSKSADQPPLVQATLGLFDLPFGFEVPYTSRAMWFMERSQGSRALFPNQPDLGARVSGGLGFARYSVALTNGVPLDDPSGLGLQDPNANKDLTARFGAQAEASPSAVVAGGISFNRGKGFSPAPDPTKPSLGLRDQNNNGLVDSGDVVALPAQVGQPSKTFDRWALGADLELLLRDRLGWLMVFGEVVAASNLDRGLYVADPILNHANLRELAYYVGVTHELTRYGLVGFRYDVYDPNADLLETRRDKLVPFSQAIHTYSGMAGLVLPERGRLLLQYDVIRDLLARDSRGVPEDWRNNQWTLRLQVNL